MSTIDPGKLKVVELRAELTSRGLDVRGNKPVLVQRLKEALEKETNTVIADTTIVDTSTEENNTTQDVNDEESEILEQQDEQPPAEEPVVKTSPVKATITSEKPLLKSPEVKAAEVPNAQPIESTQDDADKQEPMEEDSKPEVTNEDSTKPEEVTEEKPKSPTKGEKRRRTSTSPQRVQRKRSRSPIKEDEPEWESEKVILSWYDSDLNLQIDKKTLLSAKPLNEGAFGYAWAGARTTHGVQSGKVCYEVKITEELKWEDTIKQLDKRRENQRPDRRDRRRNDRRGRDRKEIEKVEDKPNLDAKDQTNENKETNTIQAETNGNAVTADVVIDKPENDTATTEEKKTEEIKNEQTATDMNKEKPAEVADRPTASIPTENGEAAKEEEKAEPMEVETPAAPALPILNHIFRCGWSTSGTPLQLGETKFSYAFDSQGKFVSDNEFLDYGASFVSGDVIGAYANFTDTTLELSYTINGVYQGIAVTIPRADLPDDFVLFPHIASRNFAYELNLGNKEEPWFPNPSEVEDFKYIQTLEDKCLGPLRPTARSECEVVMMFGLPGSGKSHWVQEVLKENPDKKYTIIGTRQLLDKMTINGKPFKETYSYRWNIVLDRVMKCVNNLVDKAAVRRRNIIIDQTNVFPSAQRRKMRSFEGFKRRAVVVVVSDEEQAKRRAQQEVQDGKDVPDAALFEMKANMSLPQTGEWLEEVKYVELGEDEAKVIVEKYNAEGKAAGFGSFNRRGGFRDNRGPYRWNRNAPRDYHDNYRDSRPYQNNRYRPPGGFQDRRPPSGNWNRDGRRDSRGPPRDDRNRSGSGSRHDRPNHRDRNSGGGYNRNSRPQGGRSQGSSWQGGAWQSAPNWGGPGYQNWGQGSWSGQPQWKGGYGQGQGGYSQGGYGSWNYYGQYANNWQN